MRRAYLEHLNGRGDLVTTVAAARAGICALSVERRRRQVPIIAQAAMLRFMAARATCVPELLQLPDIQAALLVAAAQSGGAKTPATASERRKALRRLAKAYLEPAGANFAEALTGRFVRASEASLSRSM